MNAFGHTRRIPSRLLLSGLLMFAAPSVALAAAPPSSWDITRCGLVWQVPEMARARVRTGVPYQPGRADSQVMDLYYPPDARTDRPRGAVIFINGVGDLPDNPLRQWQIYTDWARAVSTRGLIGITYGAEAGRTAEQLAALFDHLKAHGAELGIDPSRLGLFACSANVTAGLPFAASVSGGSLRAAVFYYGNAAADSLRPDLPVFYVRAERDGAQILQGIERLWQRARDAHLPWVMVEGRGLPHAFDAVDVSAGSRALVQQTLDFWCAHLEPLPAAPGNPVQRQVNAAIYAGDFAAAARLLEPIYRGGDPEPDVARLLLHCYRNLRDLDRGLPLAEELSRLHPERPYVWSAHGALLLAADRPADAARSLETAVARGARDLNTHNHLVMALLAAGDPAGAARAGEAAARLFPTAAVIHYNLACAHARNHAAGPALDALSAAIRAGYRDRRSIESDPDFESLRGDPAFQRLVGGLAE